MKQKGIGTSAVVAVIVIIVIAGYFALKGGEEIKDGDGEDGTPDPTEDGTPEPATTGNIWVGIWNDDYAYHNVIASVNDIEITRKDHFANGYWGGFAEGYEVTGTYQLEIKVEWNEISSVWTSKTYVATVGDEPAHWYYGKAGIPAGTPDAFYVEGVWTKFYYIVISWGDIGLLY